jgi:hypothetical protein
VSRLNKEDFPEFGFPARAILNRFDSAIYFNIEIVEASAIRSDRSRPDTLTQIGSPNGAAKLKVTELPGRNPISSSLDEKSSLMNPEITATSPGFMSATLFKVYLDQLNVCKIMKGNSGNLVSMKKKGKSKKQPREQTKVLPQKPKDIPPHDEEEKPFDFGGIPERDLKRNLGCG